MWSATRSSSIAVAGPRVPTEVVGADHELVAVVSLRRRVEELVELRVGHRAAPQVDRRDPGMPRAPEGAPRHVEEEVAAHRALPREDGGHPRPVVADEHVLVQQVAVDEVPPFGARAEELLDPLLASTVEVVELGIVGQRRPPPGHGAARDRRPGCRGATVATSRWRGPRRAGTRTTGASAPSRHRAERGAAAVRAPRRRQGRRRSPTSSRNCPSVAHRDGERTVEGIADGEHLGDRQLGPRPRRCHLRPCRSRRAARRSARPAPGRRRGRRTRSTSSHRCRHIEVGDGGTVLSGEERDHLLVGARFLRHRSILAGDGAVGRWP